MKLVFSFTNEVPVKGGRKERSPSFRTLDDGSLELWKGRVIYPCIRVSLVDDNGQPVKVLPSNYLIWDIVHPHTGERVYRCAKCHPVHIMSFKDDRMVEYWGDPVRSLLQDAPHETNLAHVDNTSDPRMDYFPPVRYGSLNSEDGTGIFQVSLACNSHFHSQKQFQIMVQVVEASADGKRAKRIHTCGSPYIKVVAKFINERVKKRSPTRCDPNAAAAALGEMQARSAVSSHDYASANLLATAAAAAGFQPTLPAPLAPPADAAIAAAGGKRKREDGQEEGGGKRTRAVPPPISLDMEKPDLPRTWSLRMSCEHNELSDRLSTDSLTAEIERLIRGTPVPSGSSGEQIQGFLRTLLTPTPSAPLLPKDASAGGTGGGTFPGAGTPAALEATPMPFSAASFAMESMLDSSSFMDLNPSFVLTPMVPGQSSLDAVPVSLAPRGDPATLANEFINMSAGNQCKMLDAIKADPRAWTILHAYVKEHEVK